jgi:hypothetical protein
MGRPWESLATVLRDRRPGLDAQARLQSDGTLLGFRQRVRSCRRWQLYFCSEFYEVSYILGMHLRVCDPRRNHVVPLFTETLYAIRSSVSDFLRLLLEVQVQVDGAPR